MYQEAAPNRIRQPGTGAADTSTTADVRAGSYLGHSCPPPGAGGLEMVTEVWILLSARSRSILTEEKVNQLFSPGCRACARRARIHTSVTISSPPAPGEDRSDRGSSQARTSAVVEVSAAPVPGWPDPVRRRFLVHDHRLVPGLRASPHCYRHGGMRPAAGSNWAPTTPSRFACKSKFATLPSTAWKVPARFPWHTLTASLPGSRSSHCFRPVSVSNHYP